MFDRAYFEAAMANGFEAGPADSAPFPPLTPAGLTDVARKQWVADFEVLVAYAQEERSRNSLKQGKAKKNDRRGGAFVDRVPSPPPEASTTARDSTKPPHPLRQAIQELYAANKKLANENALAEAKLQRMKATVGSLTSKLETKLETSQGHGDLMQRLSTAVNALLQHSAEENTTQDDAVHPEVALLTGQLQKLDQSNVRLQGEFINLRKQMAAARQKKKAA